VLNSFSLPEQAASARMRPVLVFGAKQQADAKKKEDKKDEYVASAAT
jgi:hypothetical protein